MLDSIKTLKSLPATAEVAAQIAEQEAETGVDLARVRFYLVTGKTDLAQVATWAIIRRHRA